MGGVLKFDGMTAGTVIKIYTLWGEKVREIKDVDSLGRSYWDGTNSNGDFVVNGIYLYTVLTGDGRKATGRLSLIR